MPIKPDLRLLPPADRDEIRGALKALEFIEVRPGRLQRSIVWRGHVVEEYTSHCPDCNWQWPEFVLLVDDLWKQVAPSDGLLCFECIEKRLGRKLVAADLSECEGNRTLLYILRTRTESI